MLVLCQATNLKPEPLSQGMQYQPEPAAEPATPVPPEPKVAPPEHQYISQVPGRNSPRDTPSLNSFTPSNEGDDERSEDSVPSNQKLPLRLSSLHDTTQKKEELVQSPSTIRDGAPIFLREIPAAESYFGSPKETQTPRSATSSNKTPTQSNFKEVGQPVVAHNPRGDVDSTNAQHEVGTNDAPEPHPRSISAPYSRFSTQAPRDNNAAKLSASHVTESDSPQRLSEESKDTFHTADSAGESNDSQLLAQDQPNPQSAEMDRLMSRAPERLIALRLSSVPKPTPLHSSGDTYNAGLSPSKTRSISPIHTPQRTLRRSQDYSLRAPSLDGLPSPVSPYHSPPSVTPAQNTPRERLEHRGREGPVHYGIDHDFVPENDRERTRSRSPSYANLSQSRPSQ